MNGRRIPLTYECLQVENLEQKLDDIAANKNKHSSLSYPDGRRSINPKTKQKEEGTCDEHQIEHQMYTPMTAVKECDLASRISNLEKRVSEMEYKTYIALKVTINK